jgi:hypothetical protein
MKRVLLDLRLCCECTFSNADGIRAASIHPVDIPAADDLAAGSSAVDSPVVGNLADIVDNLADVVDNLAESNSPGGSSAEVVGIDHAGCPEEANESCPEKEAQTGYRHQFPYPRPVLPR